MPMLDEDGLRPDTLIRVTPTGALAGAFSRLVREAEEPGAWWSKSPLLSAIGLAHHLEESGWKIVPIEDDQSQLDPDRLQRAMRAAHGRRASLDETYAQAIARKYNAEIEP